MPSGCRAAARCACCPMPAPPPRCSSSSGADQVTSGHRESSLPAPSPEGQTVSRPSAGNFTPGVSKMDTDLPASVSPRDFYARIARGDELLVLDVRRDLRFDESDRLVPRAQRCAPQDVARFARDHAPQEIIVYCVYGHEVGQEATARLAKAGWNARYLEGGIEGLAEAGVPTIRK